MEKIKHYCNPTTDKVWISTEEKERVHGSEWGEYIAISECEYLAIQLKHARQAARQIKDSLNAMAKQVVHYADILSGDTGEILDAKSLDCIYTINRLSEDYFERLNDYNDTLKEIEYLKDDIKDLEEEE